MTAAVQQRREGDHAPLADEPFFLRDWQINPTTPTSFELFNGRDEAYKNWAPRVNDQLMTSNLNWGGGGPSRGR